MCGIVGVIAKFNSGFFKKQQSLFEELLYVDALRGEDSTGIIAAMKDNTFYTVRDGLASPYTLQTWKDHEINKEIFQVGKALIGHNRKATIGKVGDDTAHPFVVENEFAMVHNGTLLNHKKLADTVVDSEALAIHLHKALETDDITKLEEALGSVNGAYAIAAYDQRSQKIHLLRNKERPLWIAELGNCWVFASEYGMLFWICQRNEASSEELKSIRFVTENTLLTFEPADTRWQLTERSLTIKKASPQPPFLVGAGDTKTTKTPTSVLSKTPVQSISKNLFKRFKKAHIYTEVEFWIDDWVEKNFPKTIEEGEREVLLLGAWEEGDINATINVVAEYTIQKPDIVDKLEDSFWKGRINDITLCKKTNTIQLTINNCRSSDGLLEDTQDEKIDQPLVH